jgi:hypothetical protein
VRGPSAQRERATSGGLTAAHFIAAKRAERAPEVPAAALAELAKLCAHNDSVVGASSRISADAARELLASHGVCAGRAALEAICRDRLGRKSWAKP